MVFNRAVQRILALAGLLTGLVGTYLTLRPYSLLGFDPSQVQGMSLLVLCTALGGLAGLFGLPWILGLVWRFLRWLEGRVLRLPLPDVAAGALGLIVGLLIASLLGSTLSYLPLVGRALPIVASVVLGYLGLSVGVRKREELVCFFSALPRRFSRQPGSRGAPAGLQPKVLDTSVIIDGRIADVCKSGFIEGPIVIPSFVLEELRRIADSSDLLRRNRGRRGLDVLNRIQKELEIPVQIVDLQVPEGEVDSRLVRVAKALEAKIITNDYNLNKVAQLHGVPVLNINELANALKPAVLPGEEMTVHIIRDGRELGQGVAYLDDGTMIVVDGGKRHIGETIGVLVTSVLQTAAGRMIFARPKSVEKAV
ncbi:MAG: TRAM domain-containing protein [Acetobacteraceae bacterium]|nr:TRAM domain-containing protein [Acetobacteraceae bacterium]